ncbi:OmpA family protein [Mucilaginibacter gynuensis]|uniref:OmpA family protein n=1 Tax=Mucilaginibacter gynuensis TaxID=1302236 RepID=A0ABP8HIE8_9SPHI
MKKLLLTICISSMLSAAFAQYGGDDTKTLGDRAFRNKDYFEAAFYYKKAATGMNMLTQAAIPYHATQKNEKKGKVEDRAYISFQLAESYRLYENYLEAEGWYNKVLTEGAEAKYPLAKLWYGVCLRANQHFDDAIKQLQQFSSSYKGEAKYIDIAKKEIANCEFAKEQYQYPILVDAVKKKGDWNSDGSDYSVIKKDDNYWFTSSRFAKDDKKHINRLYQAKGISGKPEIIILKDESNIKELEYGTPALTPTGDRMYFTRWYKEGSRIIHAIYMTDWVKDEWTAPKKLNTFVNADGSNSIQPFVTTDGKQLYFVSNKPGGQGGDDIWVSDLGNDGSPTSATNLGTVINTAFDEQAPYYDVTAKKLIYSSKGFTGLGGFDFYVSFKDADRWSKPKNMGYPINSAKDDLYFFPEGSDKNKFYISSDRESDCCLSIFEAFDKRHVVAGLVIDCDKHTPLAGVKVSFIDSLSKQVIKEVVTDASAKYAFEVTTKRPYNLRFEKDKYFSKVVPVPESGRMSNDTLNSPDVCLQAFEVDSPIVIKNVLYDYDKATLRPASKTVLDGLVKVLEDNPKISVELSAHTDSKGSDAYNLKLSKARAKACVDYIISKGISASRITSQGYGESKPIAPNTLPNGKDNPAGRQLNRRTEFKVTKVE